MSFASALRKMISASGVGSGDARPHGDGAGTSNNAAPLVVTFTHTLGADEATRRIRDGLTQMADKLAENRVVVADNVWHGHEGKIQVGALGQSVTVLVQVSNTVVRIEAVLPWLLAGFAEQARSAIQQQGTLLLGQRRV